MRLKESRADRLAVKNGQTDKSSAMELITRIIREEKATEMWKNGREKKLKRKKNGRKKMERKKKEEKKEEERGGRREEKKKGLGLDCGHHCSHAMGRLSTFSGNYQERVKGNKGMDGG